MIIIARITAAVDAAGTTTTLLFGNVDWTTGPSDTPANTPVRGRLIEAANFKRDMGSGQSLFGSVRPGYGTATIQIGDGRFDDLARYGWGWRAYELWGVDIGPYDPLPAFPAGWTQLLSATIESAEATESQLRLTLRDRLALLDKPVCTLYAGTGGAEGPSALAGQPKPRVYGQACNVKPVLVDAANLVYQVSDKPYTQPRNTYDMRVSIGPHSSGYDDAASYAALTALAITAGKFARYSTAGLLRLQSPPAGIVTVDCIRHDSGFSTVDGRPLIGQVLHDVATDAGLSSGDIDAGLEGIVGTAGHGLYVQDTSTTYLDALGTLAASAGAWVCVDRLGVLTAGIVAAPSGTPVWTFRPGACYSISRVAGAYPVPAASVTVYGGRNWTPMSASEIAGSVSVGDAATLSRDYTYSSASSGSAATKHLNAPSVRVDTTSGSVSTSGPALPGSTVGMTASTWMGLFGTERDTLEITVLLTLDVLQNVDLGDVVQVEWPRFGFDGGALFLVIGVRLSFAQRRATFVVWG